MLSAMGGSGLEQITEAKPDPGFCTPGLSGLQSSIGVNALGEKSHSSWCFVVSA